jgi:hypothetical protein
MNTELEDLRVRLVQLEAWVAEQDAKQACFSTWAAGLGYKIPPRGEPSIVCPQCGLRSYNPNDIAERYCAQCHQFHNQMPT